MGIEPVGTVHISNTIMVSMGKFYLPLQAFRLRSSTFPGPCTVKARRLTDRTAILHTTDRLVNTIQISSMGNTAAHLVTCSTAIRTKDIEGVILPIEVIITDKDPTVVTQVLGLRIMEGRRPAAEAATSVICNGLHLAEVVVDITIKTFRHHNIKTHNFRGLHPFHNTPQTSPFTARLLTMKIIHFARRKICE